MQYMCCIKIEEKGLQRHPKPPRPAPKAYSPSRTNLAMSPQDTLMPLTISFGRRDLSLNTLTFLSNHNDLTVKNTSELNAFLLARAMTFLR
jgi:hypothetical protein